MLAVLVECEFYFTPKFICYVFFNEFVVSGGDKRSDSSENANLHVFAVVE